ncbi:transcriptional regulator PpsR [Sulfitobacter aestuariivivens]|uniref:Transcriptional regulator PpsR n=1 Tax=Sulfitobacter aestuariivivens TaxID=2766981 RepID=A0A927D4J1_9RHOB|nr:transcriptional regulator PpsR [Sulfitobacter aestuariivivens]MBD3665040.1 transcriptional regulator PpsR [Sulfitobacter aestuariivivens]
MRLETESAWVSGLVPKIAPDTVTDIIARVSDMALILSRTGQIVGIMASPGFRPKSKLKQFEGAQIRDTLTVESIPKFDQRLEQHLQDPSSALTVELNHSATAAHPEFPVRYSIHDLGHDGSILLLGRDLRPIAEMQQQLVAAQITLEKDYETQRDHDTRFRALMSSIEEAIVFVSQTDGTIHEYNAAAKSLLDKAGPDLSGTTLERHFRTHHTGELLERLAEAAGDKADPTVEAQSKTGGRAYLIRPFVFRSGGEQVMMCRILPATGSEAQAETLGGHLASLYDHGLDGIVFVRSDGRILSANDAFQNMTDVSDRSSLQGRSLSEFFSRGSVDLNVILENAARAGAMRIYATRISTEFGAERPVEVSTCRVRAGKDAVFALVIRDVSRTETVRATAQGGDDVNNQSVIDLIGSQSLREIVAQTTDVVEKLCIETAVELTSNNRVAASEMLGLSRQSLYVKLRKYDLLKSGGTDTTD